MNVERKVVDFFNFYFTNLNNKKIKKLIFIIIIYYSHYYSSVLQKTKWNVLTFVFIILLLIQTLRNILIFVKRKKIF